MPVGRLTLSAHELLIRNNLFRVQQQYNDASVPVTTGRRINFLSDDPGNVSHLFSLRAQVSVNEQYQRNLTGAGLKLNFLDARLTSATDVLQRVRDIALKANDPTVDSSLVSQLASQLDDLKTELLDAANARLDNQYVFGGSKSDAKPFSGTPVVFQGNSDNRNIQASPNVQINTNLDGDQIFTGHIHTATTSDLAVQLKNSDGVGLNFHAGDVIEFSGNIGAAFSSNLTVTSSTTLGDIATALQSALQAAGNGSETASVQLDGSIKVTSGATAITNLSVNVAGKPDIATAFNFSSSIAGGGSTSSSDTLQAGTGEDLFDVIDDLKKAILSGSTSGIATSLDRLQVGELQVNEGRATIGIRTQQIDALGNTLSQDGVRMLDELSSIQDANIDQSISNLAIRETALRLIFATSSRVLSVISGLNLNQ